MGTTGAGTAAGRPRMGTRDHRQGGELPSAGRVPDSMPCNVRAWWCESATLQVNQRFLLISFDGRLHFPPGSA
jgi:hypothetical protein